MIYIVRHLPVCFVGREIWQQYNNIKSFFVTSDTIKDKFSKFFAKQDVWTRMMIVSHPSSEDAFWRHVSYIVAQFDGLYAGYKVASQSAWVCKSTIAL